MKTEHLREGWVQFTRFYCKEGYIDYWIGDVANSPNNPKMNRFQLNSFSSYYRCNNQKWVNSRELRGIRDLLESRHEKTAEEIWKQQLSS